LFKKKILLDRNFRVNVYFQRGNISLALRFIQSRIRTMEELNLPPVKIHCSVLAEDAIKSAINDYRKKNGLEELVFEERIH
jgi:NifU-like protein involved in Fe-S cluster formation